MAEAAFEIDFLIGASRVSTPALAAAIEAGDVPSILVPFVGHNRWGQPLGLNVEVERSNCGDPDRARVRFPNGWLHATAEDCREVRAWLDRLSPEWESVTMYGHGVIQVGTQPRRQIDFSGAMRGQCDTDRYA